MALDEFRAEEDQQDVSATEDHRSDFHEDEEDGEEAGRRWDRRSGTRHGRCGLEKRNDRGAHARRTK